MMSASVERSDACLAACIFAVDPVGLGGVLLRARVGTPRDLWLAAMSTLMPEAKFRRVPVGVTQDRLLGGIDLTETLRTGRPISQTGLLAAADGGVLVLPSAERLQADTAAYIAAALDNRSVAIERDAISARTATRFGVIALDEGAADDEQAPAPIRERLAIHIDLGSSDGGDLRGNFPDLADIAEARYLLPNVKTDAECFAALCAAAAQLGIWSMRPPLFALRAARAAASLAGRISAEPADVALAARLILAPRATQLPPAPENEQPPEPPAPSEEAKERDASADDQPSEPNGPLSEQVLEAAQAAIPPGLLAQLQDARPKNHRAQAGRTGATLRTKQRGRPAGVRAGDLRRGGRLSVVATLRAAAPWQPLRRQGKSPGNNMLDIRPDDFRIVRFKKRTHRTTVFVVDASGSSAMNRLAEAKGAIELLLADCYIRRDHVALIAFRGRGAEILLPPTRSLVRAKRSLAGLPGGGGTPLAAGISSATALAEALARRGESPALVFLTDGKANVAQDGTGSRERAMEDAMAAARILRAAGTAGLLIDTSPRPQASAREIAKEMGAQYLPLPQAGAQEISRAAMLSMDAARPTRA